MIVERNTVLILGAGTSMPYDFPSGVLLLRRIQNAMAGAHSALAPLLHQAGYDWAQIQQFADAVQTCGRSSIDAFLGSRQDLADVGRAAIAALLIPHENPANLFQRPE